MTTPKTFNVTIKNPKLNDESYQQMYQQSIEHPDAFWGEMADKFLDFVTPYQHVFSGTIKHTTWFQGGKLNACYHCVDRHLLQHANKVAIIYEGDEQHDDKTYTYQMLHDEVCRMSHVLKSLGIKKGDTVCIYLPMIFEAVVAMLAAARIGAVHCVIFAGFSAVALNERIKDSKSKILITTNQAIRGGKTIPLFDKAKKALDSEHHIEHVLLINEDGVNGNIKPQIKSWKTLRATMPTDYPCEEMSAEDPLFILYTSGSTGKPKGIIHTTAGYLLYALTTYYYIFNHEESDVFFACADIGWVTGHTYAVYGPLGNGSTSLFFSGTPTYPTASRLWETIDKHNVTTLYTAPTVLRTLMREGNEYLSSSSRDSLKLLGSVGEPINPDVWLWYFEQVGKSRLPICDTWWQTETGGILLSAIPGTGALKPGFAQRPFFGIKPLISGDNGAAQTGELAFMTPWPGMMRQIFNNKERYESYFKEGHYLSGDLATKDAAGDIQIIGRNDDVLNVSGHRIGSAEVENAICTHALVAEAAVVGCQHPIKGEAIYAFVTLIKDSKPSEHIKNEIKTRVTEEIGGFARPETIQWAQDLPKTRSGKIMRRLLRNIITGKHEHFGDLSTLAAPEILQTLLKDYKNSNQTV